MKEIDQDELRDTITIFQIFMVVLSIYVLIALYVDFTFDLDPSTKSMIDMVDFIICIIFQGDFFYRLYKAPSKREFLKWGWIDFVASIPWFNSFRSAKMIRAFRILRLLRAFRSIKILYQYLFKNRSQNTFVTVAVISCFLALVGSMAIFNLEKDVASSNIKTASDAIWWAVVTVTTVGYGDRYPVTDSGRVIAAILMTAGVGLFGTFTGFIASLFVEPDIKREENHLNELTRELRALHDHLRQMDAKLDRTQRGLARERKRKKRSRKRPASPPDKPLD
jgi:voltage-gated potassium channel